MCRKMSIELPPRTQQLASSTTIKVSCFFDQVTTTMSHVRTLNVKLFVITDQFLSWMRLYHIFGGLWITQFVVACQHVTIAGAVSTWYFTRYWRDGRLGRPNSPNCSQSILPPGKNPLFAFPFSWGSRTSSGTTWGPSPSALSSSPSSSSSG